MTKRTAFIPTLDDVATEIPALPNKLLPFIWYFIRQMRGVFALIFVVYALSSICDTLAPLFMKKVVDTFETTTDKSQIWVELGPWAVAFILLVIIGQPLLAQIGRHYEAIAMPLFINRIRRQLALYMNQHSFSYFQNDFAGRLASKVVETPDAIAGIVTSTVNALMYGLCVFVVTMIMFMAADGMVALVGMVWFFFYALILWHYIPKFIASSTQTHDDKSKVRGRYVDTLSSIMSVKLFARWRYEDRYLTESLKTQTQSAQNLQLLINQKNLFHEVLSVALIGGVFAVSILQWQAGRMSTGDVVMAIPAMLRLMHASWWIANVLTDFFRDVGQVQEGMSVITRAHSVTDMPGAKPLAPTSGRIEFRDVCFSYGEKELFRNFNLTIEPGQKIGLIGPSGAGKSSLIQILLRLYDVQGGQILIDGQDIAKAQQDSVREAIAVIPQSTELLHRSVIDNIRYGRLDANDDEVVEAAKRAFADDFIHGLEDSYGNKGYAAQVGERGVKLSGGQRQRVAIARAVLKHSPVLILDEATSALDSESEHYIQSALQGIMEDRTVIAIAHRLSTIAHLDRLIVMDQGRITEDGTHAELLEKGGLYARLWAMQSGGFLKV